MKQKLKNSSHWVKLNWSDLTFPPINLWSFSKMNEIEKTIRKLKGNKTWEIEDDKSILLRYNTDKMSYSIIVDIPTEIFYDIENSINRLEKLLEEKKES